MDDLGNKFPRDTAFVVIVLVNVILWSAVLYALWRVF